MTYPPQPGQPDPYGQQPQQPYPQGGWDPNQQQQQPYPTQQYPQGWDPNQQQQPAWDPNAQQHQQYGQPYGQPQQQGWDPNTGGQMSGWDPNTAYSQGFGGPPAPPKKSKTGLIIALVAVVVVLAAVGITGFVAPGFFLSKDGSSTASGPDKTAQDIVDALNRKDKAALNSLKCGNAEEDIAQIIDNVDKVSDVKLNGPVTKVSETEYTAIVAMKINGNASTRKGTLGKSGDKWCWRQVGSASSSGGKTTSPKTTEPTETGAPGSGSDSASPEGTAVIKDFIDKLNSGDTQGAVALGCADTRDLTANWLKNLLKPPYELTVSGFSGTALMSADVGGKAAGKTVDGLIFAGNTDGKGFCISSFFVT